jgi:predicted phosphodiesterase
MTKILVISDTQAPAQHPNALEFIKHEAKLFKPDRIIHIGDELDLHNLSKYVHNPDLPGAADEVEQGLEFMQGLYDLFPDVDVCISNHGARPYLRAQEAGLPSKFIRSYKEWMRAPKGWNWHHRIVIDDIAFIHGEGLSGDGARLKACTLMQRSCVFGHLHSNAGVSFFSNKDALLFGFNVGCLIDLRSPYFEYNRHQFFRPIIGLGLIDNGVPTFKPMVLDKDSLWIGRKDKSRPNKPRPEPLIETIRCRHCGSHDIRRHGLDTRRGRAVQLMRCKEKSCGRRFSLI